MNSPSPPPTSTPPPTVKGVMDAVAAAKAAGTEHGLDAFLARAELAKVTRALRARLSYASYKAANNLTHVSLHTLEQQQEANTPRSPTAGRHPPAPGSATIGLSSAQSPRPRPSQSQMMPPPNAPSLYSTLLSKESKKTSPAPPSSTSSHKRARHSSPVNPISASPRHKKSASTSAVRASNSSPQGARKKKKVRGSSPTSSRSVASTRSLTSVDVTMQDGNSTTELEDLSAAAVLTSLLHNSTTNTANNSSGSGASNPHSPTPSHASSFTEIASAPASGSGFRRHDSNHLSTSATSSFGSMLSPRPSTSLPSSQGDRSTPKAPSDADAAEMMLYLATSPSPARPIVQRTERPLIRSTGRVLFPSSTNDGAGPSQTASASTSYAGIGEPGPSRGITQSFSAFDRGQPELGSPKPEYSHTRTMTAPEPMYGGKLLPAPVSPSGTLYGDPQDSQQTAVGSWDEESNMPVVTSSDSKGKGKSVDHMPPPVSAMRSPLPQSSVRVTSPMSVDGVDDDPMEVGDYGYGGYLTRDPDPGTYAESLRSPIPVIPTRASVGRRIGSSTTS